MTHVVVAPIGFVSDHVEVVYDLDTEAAETAERLGLVMRRVPTVGTDDEFVHGLVDLVEERAAEARDESPGHAGRGHAVDLRPGLLPQPARRQARSLRSRLRPYPQSAPARRRTRWNATPTHRSPCPSG